MKQNKKRKKTELQILKDKLDAVFSKYVRNRDADENGYCRCITCGKVGLVKEFHCGHFLSRRYLSIRWDEHNCGAQCPGCNLFNQGRQYEMGQALEKRYGKDKIELLLIKKNNICKMDRFKYLALIDVYRGKLQAVI